MSVFCLSNYVYTAVHMTAASSLSICKGLIWSIDPWFVFYHISWYLPGLVHGPEPDPQQTRKEASFGGCDPDRHQPDGVRSACSTCQEQQQVDIHLVSFFIIPNPNTGDSPDSWVYHFSKEWLCEKGMGKKPKNVDVGALGVMQSYITISMVVENIVPKFFGKESIRVNQESAGM